MSGKMKEWCRSKKLLEKKVGFESKTEFRVWPKNWASAFSRANPQGLTQHSALSTQDSTYSTKHSALSTQHSTNSIKHSALSTQHSALENQPSSVNPKLEPCQVLWRCVASNHPSTVNVRKLFFCSIFFFQTKWFVTFRFFFFTSFPNPQTHPHHPIFFPLQC